MSPLPSGMEPKESPLGESQVTSNSFAMPAGWPPGVAARIVVTSSRPETVRPAAEAADNLRKLRRVWKSGGMPLFIYFRMTQVVFVQSSAVFGRHNPAIQPKDRRIGRRRDKVVLDFPIRFSRGGFGIRRVRIAREKRSVFFVPQNFVISGRHRCGFYDGRTAKGNAKSGRSRRTPTRVRAIAIVWARAAATARSRRL